MANTKKKSGAKKSNTKAKGGKNTRSKRKTKAEIAKQKKMRAEVAIWIFSALAVFLFLSNFGICGNIGNMLRHWMLGSFGTMGYVFPIVLVVVIGLIVFNEFSGKVFSRICGILLTFFDVGVMLHLFAHGNTSADLQYFYNDAASGTFGGGAVGASLGKTFCQGLGLVGAYLLVLILLIICIVVLTEKSLVDGIKDKSQSAYENIKEEAAYRREENQILREKRREEKKLKKRRTRVIGVDFGDTTIAPETKKGQKTKDSIQEVHEIHFEGFDDGQSEELVQDSTTYTYDASKPGQQMQIEGVDETPKASEHATDGEFQPKERVIVSESAKNAMNRKPYGLGGNGEAPAEEAVIPEHVTDTKKKASNEGKIIAPTKKKMVYKKPPYSLLKDNPGGKSGTTKADLMATANKLKQVLANFGVNVEVTNVSKGPSVTRYELQPEMGTKVSRITGLTDDIKLNMAAADIRIEAPIPGKAAVGIEIPNEGRDPVFLKELLNSPDLKNHKSKLAFPAGKDIAGRVVVADIAKMPHMLIAGTTGSGKSVFTNSILMSILYRSTPEEVRLIVIDPKVVEFQVYNKIPHLLYDVVTDPKKAAGILNWAVAEMTARYKKFANIGAKDIGSYNAKVDSGDFPAEGETPEKLPQILIIIDELADLMMVAAKEVEEAICRLAQLARAAGIHMVIATQRPSVDVITGLIKANIPSRVALTVASGTDSRTILDMYGAEKLLGNGDMLFYPAGYIKPVRLQGAYVSEGEIAETVRYIIDHSGEAEYDTSIDAKLVSDQEVAAGGGDERDPIFAEAGRLCIEKQKGSTSMLQRQFKVGFNRAARVMEQLYDAGVVGQEEVNKPRKVIMSMEEFEMMLGGNNNNEE